ncbi:hypothetical protein BaRGS_00030923 [Batillaria attramentaria]|uniref:Neurotransmitter-gated ion-channel transmembrane domain-containing protein n=1 Tax=Batillaria attramentaria TaxID=370345 RepID=A0ABD0JRZ5_9CAEN
MSHLPGENTSTEVTILVPPLPAVPETYSPERTGKDRRRGQGLVLSSSKEEESSETDTAQAVWDSGLGAYCPLPPVSQPKVFVRVVFLKIGEIDTLKEQFRAEVFVQARWREPALDHVTSVDDISWHSLWNPQLQLENAMDDPKVTAWHDLKLSDSGEAYVLEKRRHLSVIITSRLSDVSLELLEDDTELSSVNLLTFVDEQEWEVRDIVEMIPEVRTREFSAIKHKFPMITVRTYAFRRAGFFLWNVLAVMVLICSLSLCTFAVERTLPQNRLQLSFTLVLTGIAFKFVVNQALPKISYLTVLDKYILGSMVMMHVVSVWHAIVTRFDHNKELADDLDEWAFVILVLCYGFYNIGFAVVMTVKVYMKRKAVTSMEVEYQEKVVRLLERDTAEKGHIIRKSKRLNNNTRVGITI